MAKNSIRDFSATAASNTDIQSVDIDENCAASGINNAIRELMADIKDVSTGTVNLETPAADRLDVDNIRIDGNTISSTDTNGNITLDPAGTGKVDLALSSSTAYSSSDFDQHYNILRVDNADTTTGSAAGIFFQVGSNGEAAISVTRTGDGQADMCFGTRGGGARKERMRLRNTGELLINRATGGSSTCLHMEGNETLSVFQVANANSASNRGAIRFRRNDGAEVGSIQINNSSTNYFTSSDHRLKENVEDMTGAITRVKQLQPKRFSFIANDLDDANIDGFLAHEAQTVVPEAVQGTHNEVDDDGNAVMQSIDQSKLVPLLTGALQEAITKIETLETEMTALKARVTELEA